jgi:hypothetical protein
LRSNEWKGLLRRLKLRLGFGSKSGGWCNEAGTYA